MSRKQPGTLKALLEKQLDDMETALERTGVGINTVTLGFWEWELTNKDALSSGSLLGKNSTTPTDASIINRMTTYARIWASAEEHCETIGMGIYWCSAQRGYFFIDVHSLGTYEINSDKIKRAIKASKRWRKAA